MKNIFKKTLGLALTIVALSVLVSPVAVQAEKPYTFTTIDFPGATATLIWGINDGGDLVGFYRDAASQAHGFSLINGSYAAFDYQGISSNTTLVGIGPSGEIVGDYMPDSTQPWRWQSFRITKQGDVVPANDPVHASTVPIRLMPDGSIVGFVQATASASTKHGVVMRPDGTIEYNELPNSQHNDATPSLNILVGHYVTPDGRTHGYILENGNLTTFDVPGSLMTTIYGVSAGGHVVAGSYRDGSNKFHGYVAERRGANGGSWEFTTIDVPGASRTFVTSINAGGELAGAYLDINNRQHGFIASRTGR